MLYKQGRVSVPKEGSGSSLTWMENEKAGECSGAWDRW